MAFHNFPLDRLKQQSCDTAAVAARIEESLADYVSRRDFLRQGIAGAAAVPGLMIFSSAALAADNAKSPSNPGDASVVQYSLRVASTKAAPDGRDREVYAYNGKIPGPVIRAKLGQMLKIKVTNDLSVPTSVHWHGMHQPGTWQMDGVDQVSRAPIPPGHDFTYEFTATPAGTHWYHSHVGVQYSDGLFGPLIVDEPSPPAKYDREEIVLISDWFLQQSDAILAGLLKSSAEKPTTMDAKAMPGQKTGAGNSPPKADDDSAKTKPMPSLPKSDGMNSVLAPAAKKPSDSKPGMAPMAMSGKPDIADVPFQSGLINGQGRYGKSSPAELAQIKIKRGETLRLRLISGASTYQFRFQIDGHPLTVIATDGAAMQSVEVDSLLISPGERYDVLLKATGKQSAWIRAVTLDGNEVKAILLYTDGAAGELSNSPVAWGQRELLPAQMKSPTPVNLAPQPQEIKLTLGGTMAPYAWNINGQKYPDADPIKLAPNKPVRFLLENPTMMDHPFHLHGHYFHVLGPPDKLNLVDPVEKDSVNVPAKGALVLQWTTTNPGRWFFHCHIEWHLATGMARVIEIA